MVRQFSQSDLLDQVRFNHLRVIIGKIVRRRKGGLLADFGGELTANGTIDR